MAQVIGAFSGEPYNPGTCRMCGADLDGASKFHCKACHHENSKRWIAANPETKRLIYRKWQLKANFGLTVEEYDAMFDRQEGRCASCQDLFRRTPNVDHDHETGKVRGLLCGPCNRAAGMCFDDPARLRLLADYIERTRGA